MQGFCIPSPPPSPASLPSFDFCFVIGFGTHPHTSPHIRLSDFCILGTCTLLMIQVVLDVRGVSGSSASASTATTTPVATTTTSGPINWPLFGALARRATLALALDDGATGSAKQPAAASATAAVAVSAGTPAGGSSAAAARGGAGAADNGKAAATGSSSSSSTSVAEEAEMKRLAGLAAFALAAVVPGPRAALSLAAARAAGAGSTGAGAGKGGGGSAVPAAAAGNGGVVSTAERNVGGGVQAELTAMLSSVRFVRPGLAEKIAAEARVGVGAASGGGGAVGAKAGGGDEEGGLVVKEFVLRCAMTEPQARVYSAVAR